MYIELKVIRYIVNVYIELKSKRKRVNLYIIKKFYRKEGFIDYYIIV